MTSRQKSRVKLSFPEFHACEWLQLGLSCSSGRLLSRCPGVIPVGEPLGRFCVSILSAHVQKSHPFVGVASRAASRAGFQTFSTEDTAENPRGFCSYNKIPPLLYLYPAFEPDSSRGCVRKSDLKILIFNGNLYTKRYRVCSKNQLLKHHVIVSCLLCLHSFLSRGGVTM